MDRFTRETVFITGGTQGIGLGMARAFAREGAKLALADFNNSALVQAKKELTESRAEHCLG